MYVALLLPKTTLKETIIKTSTMPFNGAFWDFIRRQQKCSLSANVLWGSFVTHSFLPHVGDKWMRDKRTPKDVCGEANKNANNLQLDATDYKHD